MKNIIREAFEKQPFRFEVLPQTADNAEQMNFKGFSFDEAITNGKDVEQVTIGQHLVACVDGWDIVCIPEGYNSLHP